MFRSSLSIALVSLTLLQMSCAGPSGRTDARDKTRARVVADPTRIFIRQRDAAARAVDAHSGSTLFADPDAAIVIEWAMERCPVTIVESGRYVASGGIAVPRSGVTLVLEPGAHLTLRDGADAPKLSEGKGEFRAFVYNGGHDQVRLLHLGTITLPTTTPAEPPWIPIVFDGRNRGGCGIDGGTILAAGEFENARRCGHVSDARRLSIPIYAAESVRESVLVVEGCEDLTVGAVLDLDTKSESGPALDLNGSNRRYEVDFVLGTAPSSPALDIDGSPDGIVHRAVCYGETDTVVRRRNDATDTHTLSQKPPLENTNVLVEASQRLPAARRWEFAVDADKVGADSDELVLRVELRGRFEAGVEDVWVREIRVALEGE